MSTLKNIIVRMKTRISLFSIGILLIIFSCEKNAELSGNIVNDPELLNYLYEHATDTVLVANQQLFMETYPYRNFTPGVLPSERNNRLIVTLSIVNVDSLVITEKLKAIELFVIKGEQIWKSIPKDDNNYSPEFKKNLISRNGPEWGTDIYVDVVLKIEDLENSNYKYLISREQQIHRVE